MPDFGIYAGDTNKTIYVRLRDATTGLAKTGLAFGSAGAVCSYTLPLAARAAITLATQTVTGAHSDGGFVEVDATNCKGLYRLDLPDAAIASGDFTIISIEFDGIIEESIAIPLHFRKVNAVQVSGTTQTAGDLQAGIGAIKVKSDFLPSATAGGSGGVFIAGTNAATTITSSFGNALTLLSNGSNGHGLEATGNGSGQGIRGVGGATGQGIHGVGGATSGAGIRGSGTANAQGIYGVGAGTGAGVSGVGGSTGQGILGTGGTASGAGIRGVGTATNAHGIDGAGATTGTGAGIRGTGGTTGNGILGAGGSTSGSGIRGTGTAGNANGIYGVGQGSGSGLAGLGGATGHGLFGQGGTNGDGIKGALGGSGVDIRGAITGNITGTLSTVTTLTNLPAITTDWLTAAGTAADFTTEIQTGLATASALSTAQSDLTAIVADTNELQTDWADGGRLDLILDSAASAGDPWSTALPGAYGAGTAGEIIGDWKNAGRLDAILDTIASDTTTTIPALIATAQSDLDIITGASGVNLLTATQASIDAIEADTNELQTDWVNGGRLDLILDSAASAGDPWATALPGAYGAGTAGEIIGDWKNGERLDTILDSILTDTGTTLDGKIDTIGTDTAATQALAVGSTGFAAIDTVVDAILVDTAALGAPVGVSFSADIAAIKAQTNTIATDTTTDIPALIATAQADLDIITGASGVNLLTATQASIDAIEADTNSLNDTKIPNTISLAAINAEVDTALTDYDGPTNAEMEARTLVAANYFDPAADTVANVTLVATTTTNTDMRGTDSALLASAMPTNWGSLVISVAGLVDANTQKINDVDIEGDGSGTPFNV